MRGSLVCVIPFAATLACASSSEDHCPYQPDLPIVAHSRSRTLSQAAPGRGRGAALMVADLDDDGVLDVIASRGMPHEEGSLEINYGGQTSARIITADRCYGGLAVGDLDHDGCLDVAVAFENPPGQVVGGGVDIYVGHRRGTRCEIDPRPATTLDFPDGSIAANVALGDFDHDGRLDLAATGVAKWWVKPTSQLLCFNDSHGAAGELEFRCHTLDTLLGGAFAVEFADIDGDARADLVFGGRGATSKSGAVDEGAWALVVRGQASRAKAQELVLTHACEDGPCESKEIPNLTDLEVIANPVGAARIAAVFSNHVCSSRARCLSRSVVGVFEVGELEPDTQAITPRTRWSSAGTCNGNLAAIEAVSLEAEVGARPALLIGTNAGSRKDPAPGRLLLVTDWEDEGEWSYGLGPDGFHPYALAAADLDASDSDPPRVTPSATSQVHDRFVALERPLHWMPKIRCGGKPVLDFSYAIEATYLTLGSPCSNDLEILVREERAQDILYIAPNSDSPTSGTDTIQILEFEEPT